jgi:PmbA protein
MMRVKMNGKLGIASATTADAPFDLIEQARQSAEHGEEIPYAFSQASEFKDVDTYSDILPAYGTDKTILMCQCAIDAVKKALPDIAVSLKVDKKVSTITVATSAGTRAVHRESMFSFAVFAPIKGAGMGVHKHRANIGPFEYPRDIVDEFIKFYKWTEKTRTPESGRMPVIWSPQAMTMFGHSICAGMSGKELVKKTSPLMEKLEKQILSDKLRLVENPHSAGVGVRAFDDEGVPTEKRTLIDNGVLKSFLLDLRSAAMLGVQSSGNGFKRSLFGGGYDAMPNPWPGNLWIEPGAASLDEMIALIDKGILLTGGLGFHSGNWPQGTIAVQAVGFMIEKGEVAGRLDNTMVSTNIYDDFVKIRMIGSQNELTSLGYLPYVMVDSMQVVGT